MSEIAFDGEHRPWSVTTPPHQLCDAAEPGRRRRARVYRGATRQESS